MAQSVKRLPRKQQGWSFSPNNHVEKTDMVVYTCNPSMGGVGDTHIQKGKQRLNIFLPPFYKMSEIILSLDFAM